MFFVGFGTFRQLYLKSRPAILIILLTSQESLNMNNFFSIISLTQHNCVKQLLLSIHRQTQMMKHNKTDKRPVLGHQGQSILTLGSTSMPMKMHPLSTRERCDAIPANHSEMRPCEPIYSWDSDRLKMTNISAVCHK